MTDPFELIWRAEPKSGRIGRSIGRDGFKAGRDRLKFLHTADWQIGMKAVHVGPVGEIVRRERIEAVRRCVALAIERNVDFILVAGDAFEHNGVEPVLVQTMCDILARFPGPVYLLPGNHDPLVAGSVWDHPAWRASSSLHVLREAQPLLVPGGTLYPCPLRQKQSRTDPTQWIDARGASGIAIGAAHGSVVGVSPHEQDHPIARDAAGRAGLHYLALGHWHSTATYAEAGAVRMAYSGTHETTKFGERDSGNVLEISIAGPGAAPQVVPLRAGRLEWLAIETELRESGDLAALGERIESLADPQRTLLELRLQGILDADEAPLLDRIGQIVQSRFLFARVLDAGLVPAPGDGSWFEELPGPFRAAAERLYQWSDPGFEGDRPESASPDVAARAVRDLYALLAEIDR